MGSNVGNQIRKLYEPHLYPNSGIFAHFDKYFGVHASRNLQEVCAVGFEPNKAHIDHLKKVEESYNKCGWRTIIHTLTGVNISPGTAKFVETGESGLAMASHLDIEGQAPSLEKEWPVAGTYEVNIIRIADYINKVVGTRKLPSGRTGVVVMKLDVEGREGDIIFDMMYSGALQYVDNVHFDNPDVPDHPFSLLTKEVFSKMKEFIDHQKLDTKLNHMTEIVHLDDESYWDDIWTPFPEC